MAIKLEAVFDCGNDVLEVTGSTRVDGERVELAASGWVSAMTNHFPAKSYTPEGHLREGAEPREMSEREKRAYCLGLLKEQAARDGSAVPEPLDLSVALS